MERSTVSTSSRSQPWSTLKMPRPSRRVPSSPSRASTRRFSTSSSFYSRCTTISKSLQAQEQHAQRSHRKRSGISDRVTNPQGLYRAGRYLKIFTWRKCIAIVMACRVSIEPTCRTTRRRRRSAWRRSWPPRVQGKESKDRFHFMNRLIICHGYDILFCKNWWYYWWVISTKLTCTFLSIFFNVRLETEFAGRAKLWRIKKGWKNVHKPLLQRGIIYL